MDQDDDRPVLDAETPERKIELVPSDDSRCLIGDTVPAAGKQPKVAAMTSFATRFGVAGIHKEPMGPGLEPIGIPEAREMAPRVEQCLLRGVLGEVRVTQDPARHGVQGVTDAFDQLVERLFVAAHRLLDELPHSLTHCGAGRDRGQSVSMRGLARRAFKRQEDRPRDCPRPVGMRWPIRLWCLDLDRVDQCLEVVCRCLVVIVLAGPHDKAISLDVEDPHTQQLARTRDQSLVAARGLPQDRRV